MAQVTYWTLLLLPLFMECSPQWDTEGTLKKIGLLFIVIGALLFIADRYNTFIELGTALLLFSEAWKAYIKKHGRRVDDFRQSR